MEEPPPPKAVYFNRTTTIDTRISCALVYWATRGNTHILSHCSRWSDVTQHQEDLEKSNSKAQGGKGNIPPKYLVWVQLLLCSPDKSIIVADEAEYYSTHDPSRKFREMELKSLATKELVITDDFDEDDLSDDSDSDSEESDEDEEELDEDLPQETDSKVLQNNRIVSLKPNHKKIYKQMLDDRYAMALLHFSASEYVDDSSPPADFNLYEDSQKISKEYLSKFHMFLIVLGSPNVQDLSMKSSIHILTSCYYLP